MHQGALRVSRHTSLASRPRSHLNASTLYLRVDFDSFFLVYFEVICTNASDFRAWGEDGSRPFCGSSCSIHTRYLLLVASILYLAWYFTRAAIIEQGIVRVGGVGVDY